MSAQIVTTRPDVFDFLRLPPELRNRIYQLHLSKVGDVVYYSGPNICDKLSNKPLLGVNILRVCSRVYHEAVTFAYTGRIWDLGRTLPVDPGTNVIDCAQRLSCVPQDTVGRIQNLVVTLAFGLDSPACVVTSVKMGDLTKLKSLQFLDLFLYLSHPDAKIPSWLCHPDIAYHSSPFFIGLVCQIISQIPKRVSFNLWPVVGGDWKGPKARKLIKDIRYIVDKFFDIKGCDCATSA